MSDAILEPWRLHATATVPARPLQPLGPINPQTAPDITQAISDRTDSLVVERLLLKKGIAMTTPNLDGLQGAFATFTQRVEAAAQGLTKRMDDVAALTETAVTKFGAAVDKVEAQAKTIDDAANQLTNGGPPLGN